PPAVGGAIEGAGGGVPGVGGSAPGSGGATGGGDAAGGSGGSEMTDSSPYFESGAWHGYAYIHMAGAGSTMMPMDLSGVDDLPYCISGSVGATADYSGLAMIEIGRASGREEE